jgi:hypothetical protein
MGKKTYFIDGSYYIIDDEELSVKKLVAQDDANIPTEVIKKLLMAVVSDKSGKD